MSKDEEIPLQGTQHTLDEAIELTGTCKKHIHNTAKNIS